MPKSDFGSFADTLSNVAVIARATVMHRETMDRVQAAIGFLPMTPPAPVVARN